MGGVYKAVDTRLQRPVVLKFVADELGGDAAALSRFEREARTASALNHPGFCRVYDVGLQDGRSFIAMEYLDGTTLKQRLAAAPFGLDTALAVGIQIADALDAAHTAGIVHRDIKRHQHALEMRGQSLGISSSTWRTRFGRLSGVARSTRPRRARTYPRTRPMSCVRVLIRASRDTQIVLTSWLIAVGMCTDGRSIRHEASLSTLASRTSFLSPRRPTPRDRTSVAAITRTSCPARCASAAIRKASCTFPG